MDMRIDASRRDNQVLPSNDFCCGPDHNGDTGLDIWIAGLPNSNNASRLDADIGLNDSRVIDDDRIGNHCIDRIFRFALRLSHPVANYLAATKFYFFSVDSQVLLDL